MLARFHSPSVRICVAIALLALSGSITQAQEAPHELCVTCEEPFAVYRCAFDEYSQITVAAPGAPLACAKQLAHRGSHARCSITRSSGGACEGERVVVAPPVDSPLPALTAGAPDGSREAPSTGMPSSSFPGDAQALEKAPAEGASQEEVANEQEPEGPPKTVEELAKRTAKSSKEGLKDAGDAVAGAAKKTGETIGEAGSAIGKAAKSTWRCLSTLFSDC